MDLLENTEEDMQDDDESETEEALLEDEKLLSPTTCMMPPSYSPFLAEERNVWASKIISAMKELLLDQLDDGIRKVLREWKRSVFPPILPNAKDASRTFVHMELLHVISCNCSHMFLSFSGSSNVGTS
jgi:hypothetical protein